MTMLAVVLLMLQIDGRAPEMYSVILDATRTSKDAVIVIESDSLEIPHYLGSHQCVLAC